jgi:hypothetical protein
MTIFLKAGFFVNGNAASDNWKLDFFEKIA